MVVLGRIRGRVWSWRRAAKRLTTTRGAVGVHRGRRPRAETGGGRRRRRRGRRKGGIRGKLERTKLLVDLAPALATLHAIF